MNVVAGGKRRVLKVAAVAEEPHVRLVAAAVAFILLIHLVYANMISPIYAYLGNTYREPHFLYYPLAVVAGAALTLLLPTALRRASDFILWMMYFLVVAPSMTVPHYLDVGATSQAATITVAVGAIFAFVVVGARFQPRIANVSMSLKPTWTTFILIAISVCIYSYIQIHVGLRIQLVAPADVYDLRFQYRDAVAGGSAPLLGYLVRWQANVVNPILIAQGIFANRPLPLLFGLVGQLVLFPVTGFKMTLFSIPALVGVALFLRFRPQPTGLFMSAMLAALVGFSIVADKLLGGLYLTLYFVFRMILTPGVLTGAYVDVFEGQPKAMWGHSFLSGLVEYPYTEPPSFIVGELFRNSEETSANANLFADGYANMGYPGMLLEGCALVLMLWLLNWATRGLPVGVTTVVLLMPVIATSNSGIHTSLLTNGLAPAFLLLLLLPRTGWTPQQRRSLKKGRLSLSGTLSAPPNQGQESCPTKGTNVSETESHP